MQSDAQILIELLNNSAVADILHEECVCVCGGGGGGASPTTLVLLYMWLQAGKKSWNIWHFRSDMARCSFR